jgi:hypothetical protein
MPKIGQPISKPPRPQPTPEPVISEGDLFRDASGWSRSRKGNLWRKWDGMTVSIFPRRGGFAWSITEDDSPQYSPSQHETEEDALDDLAGVLGMYPE